MGGKSSSGSSNDRKISKSDFIFDHLIGRGGFSKVWKVTLKKEKSKVYAMKQISKALIVQNRSIFSFIQEWKILSSISNPFLIQLHYAFQDKNYLYWVLDYISGGDWRYHFMKTPAFTERQAKFFICSVILGLECLYHNNIIHRDIKPENLLIDKQGYLIISDLGIASHIKEMEKGISGTLGYIPPEVLLDGKYSMSCDFFAIGVICFELMFRRRPYEGNSSEIKYKFEHEAIVIKRNEIPKGWSRESADFVNKLIQKNPSNRLGCVYIDELKSHLWLRDFPWDDWKNRRLVAPYIPQKNERNFNVNYINEDLKITKETKLIFEKWRKDLKHGEDPFKNYYFKSEKIHGITNTINAKQRILKGETFEDEGVQEKHSNDIEVNNDNRSVSKVKSTKMCTKKRKYYNDYDQEEVDLRH